MSDNKKKLELLVDALPKTLDGLVEYLRLEDCKGNRSDVNSCPLANHFKARGVNAAVSGSTIEVDGARIPTPSNLRKFVQNFDTSHYPDLIK